MTSKKLIAGMIALAMAVAIVPGATQAATAEELAAQIAALQSQLAGLMGQLGGDTTATAGTVSATAPAACAGISFTRNLTLGSQGTDVKCLQTMLNQDPTTAVAVTGVGSAGNETMYFGGLTKAAVVAFQNKYAAEILAPVGLTAGTGFVGASTRAKLNAMLAGGTTTGTTGDTGTTGTTGDTTTTGGLTMTGAEGAITVSINPSPANGVKLYEGDGKVSVLGIKVKATGSDVDVQRATLRFADQPYSYFTNVYLYDGDTEVASAALNSTTVSKVSSTNYQITLSGFASKVIVAKNAEKVLTVKLDVLPGISSGLLTAGVKNTSIGMPSETAVRAVDQAGLNQYGGVAYDTAATYRAFSVNQSQSANATLTLSLNANSPKKRNIIADSSQELNGVTLMAFDLKATKDNLIVDEILDVDFGSSGLPTTAYVVDDGGTVIGTITPSATATSNDFTELNYTIAKDTTKTLSIKIDESVAAPDSTTHVSTNDGDTYTVVIGSGKIGFTKTNGSTGTSTGTATSNAAYVYGEGAELSLTSITTTNTQAPFSTASSTLSATFNINVAAKSGDVYIANSGAFTVHKSIGGATSTVSDVTYVQPSNTVASGSNFKISDGNNATFAVNATFANAGVAGTYDLRIAEIKWGHVTDTPTAVTSSFMNGEAAWISPAVYLR